MKILKLKEWSTDENMFDIFEEFEGSNYPPILSSSHVTVIVSDKIVDADKWIQKRTHHKKRINKKWRKRYGMIHPPLENCLLIGDILYVHPVTYKKVFKNFDGIIIKEK